MEKTDLYLEKYTVVSKQSWWQGFKRAVYNPREKTVFYRNKSSWAKIILFYICFYGCLAGFFAICLGVFLSTVPPLDNGPKFTMYNLNPGIVATPSSYPPTGATNANAVNVSRSQISMVLAPYMGSRTPFECGTGRTCLFDASTLQECGRAPYGFTNRTGCIILSMNKVWNWIPAVNNTALDYVPVYCNAIKTGDLNPKPTVTVINGGFTRSFYPFNGQQNYQKPLVAVRFDLVDKPYQIHCTLNATNVQISPAANKLSEAQVFVGVNQPQ